MKGYSKILARISIAIEAVFKKAHYIKEAAIPGYSVSGEDLLFMSRFLGETRSREYHPDRLIPRIRMATAIGKMVWHSSGWAINKDPENPHFIWIRTPYTPGCPL